MTPQLPPLTADTRGHRIREAYVNAGYNRTSLMRELGVAYSTIYAWERGRQPRVDALQALSRATGYPVGEILGEVPTERGDAPTESALESFASSPMATGITAEELASIKALDFGMLEPTAEAYAVALLALRGGSSLAEAARAAIIFDARHDGNS